MDRKEEIAELRRRLEQLEGEDQFAAPQPAPVFATKPARPDRVKQLGVAGGVIGALLLVGYCASSGSGSSGYGSEPTMTQQQIAADVADVPMQALPEGPSTPWRYREVVDPMTDGKTHFACVTSTNEVRLYPPYRDTKAELCIRRSPRYGLDAYVQLNNDGQIICRSYNDCTVKVRFGDQALQSFSAADAADGSSDIIFITNASRFLAGVKDADVTRIQMTLYQAGDQVVEFATDELEWPRPEA